MKTISIQEYNRWVIRSWYLFGIAIGILLSIMIYTSLASGLYEGESQTFNLTGTFDNLTNITFYGNTSPIGFTMDNLIVNIIIPTVYDGGNFSIVFGGWSNGVETTTTTNVDYGGGGCTTTWRCSGYGTCINNTQSRTCSKVLSYCYANPINLTQSCITSITPLNNITINNTENYYSNITNSSVPPNDSGTSVWVYVIIAILIIGIGIVIYFIAKSKDLNTGGGLN